MEDHHEEELLRRSTEESLENENSNLIDEIIHYIFLGLLGIAMVLICVILYFSAYSIIKYTSNLRFSNLY